MGGYPERLLEVTRLAAGLDPEPGSERQAVASLLLGAFGRLLGGDPAGAAPMFEEALVRAEALDEPRQVLWAAAGGVFIGDRGRALQSLDRAVVLARERAAVALLPHILGLRANLALWDGRLPEAGADADEAARLAADVGAENARALPITSLAWLTGLRGDEAECRRLADEVLEIAIDRGLAMPAASATWALAQLDVALGRWDEALRAAARAGGDPARVRPPDGAVMTSWDRVEAAVRCGRPDVAEQSIERFAAWAAAAPARLGGRRARGLPGADRAARRGRARTSRPRSSSIAAARPLDRARVHLHYGEHLRRERRRIDARVHLRAALEGFERLGAVPWAERARRELRATGETARKRDISPLAELTPQELQVARLVGEGATNKAVAAQLFVSPKTVEYHLRKVFAKLGIASRSELIRLDLGSEQEAGAAV